MADENQTGSGGLRGRLQNVAPKGSIGKKAIMGMAALAGAGLVYATVFAPNSEGVAPQRQSQSPEAPDVPSTPDQTPASDQYQKEQQRANDKRAEQALETGESSMDTLTVSEAEESEGFGDLQPEEEKKQPEKDPELEEKEPQSQAETDKPEKDVIQTGQQNPAPVYDPKLVSRIKDQMKGIVSAQKPVDAQVKYLTKGDPYKTEESAGRSSGSSGAQPTSGTSTQQVTASGGSQGNTAQTSSMTSEQRAEVAKIKKQLPQPGEIVYAEMISQANSDAPGPVIARVLQGEFSGARLLGSFQKKEESLVIEFDRMSLPDRDLTVSINAVAVDTDHIGTQMATEVDRHIGFNLAAAFTTSFIEGVSNAITQGGSTVVLNGSGETVARSQRELDPTDQAISGLGAAAKETRKIINQEFGDRPTTVKVASGTPIGLLFLE